MDVVISIRAPNLFVFARSIGLGTEIGSGRAGLGEVPSEHGLQERSEDELGTAEGGKRQPEQEDKLKCVIEREPVDNTDDALNYSEEGENDPVSEPLGVISFARAKQGTQGVVAGNEEAGQVGQQLATEVENNEEKVESSNANNSVDLGNR